MKRIATLLLIFVVSLLAVVVVRTIRLPSQQRDVPPLDPAARHLLDENQVRDAAGRLGAAIRIATVAHGPGHVETAALIELHALLANTFPRVYAAFPPEVINDHSLLFTWPGRDPRLEPALLMGHLDVVPVAPGTEEEWQYPPFSGTVANGFVWGRGAMDDKVNVLGVLEAAEHLLGSGFTPERTLYFAFGHDEEVGGDQGAAQIVSTLRGRGIRLHLVLDEGLAVIEGLIPGLDRPAGLIGIAEKGMASFTIEAQGTGGHSSMPPDDTAVTVLAQALLRVRDAPLPRGIDGVTGTFFDTLAPELPFGPRAAMANRWLFGPLIEGQLAAAPTTRAVLGTTTAPTMIQGGVKPNVLPPSATAVVNFRVHPRDTIDGIAAHLERAIDDARVTVRVRGTARPASEVSPTDNAAYDTLARTVHELFPEAVVAPALVVAGTDARHYEPIADSIYRFTPMVFGDGDAARIHGTNERLEVADYGRVIAFYARLMRSL